MRTMAFITSLVLFSGAAAGDDRQPPAAPEILVGVFGYRADGSSPLAAWDTLPSTNSVVSITSLCSVTGGLKAPLGATDAWRFSGKVLSSNLDEAVLELEWQRIVDRGEAVTAPTGNVQLTLKAGEHVVLDRVIPDAPSRCSITGASFEARYSRARLATGLQRSEESRGESRGGGARIEGRVPEWRLRAQAVMKAVDVNLWLVHSAPGRPDEVLHQTLLATNRGAAFAFSPVTVDTTQGPVAIQVTGSLAVTSSGVGDQLVFTTNRRVTSARSDLPVRDTAPDSHGSSRTTIPMPAPTDVLSFEMPPLRLKGLPALPDQFSVRVRVTPR